MVVMHFNAKATVCAVEGPRRSYDLARIAVGKSFYYIRLYCLVCNNLKPTKAEICFNRSQLLGLGTEVILISVCDLVDSLVVYCFCSDLRNYAWLNSRAQEQDAQSV